MIYRPSIKGWNIPTTLDLPIALSFPGGAVHRRRRASYSSYFSGMEITTLILNDFSFQASLFPMICERFAHFLIIFSAQIQKPLSVAFTLNILFQ
jgi:hypothetical protein